MIKFRTLIYEENEEIKSFISDETLNVVSCADLNCENYKNDKYSADLIIIDMQNFNETDVFKYVSENSDINIIVVNANENLKYQIYECGAIDVMAGILDKIELKYKINTFNKRSKYKSKRYFIGDMTYEPETGTLMKDDKSIVLPTLQNKVFALLLNAYYDNKIVKKEDVFKSMIDESSRIQNHIARLRYSLTYVKSRRVIIETVYGKGYKLLVMD